MLTEIIGTAYARYIRNFDLPNKVWNLLFLLFIKITIFKQNTIKSQKNLIIINIYHLV
jgi:hypothetical protein